MADTNIKSILSDLIKFKRKMIYMYYLECIGSLCNFELDSISK